MGTQQRTKKRQAPKVWRPAFLAALERLGSVVAACEASGVAHRTVYDNRTKDEDFRADWDAALDRAADHLEREAIRRASEGWDEPVFHNGQLCGHKRRYSDVLLIFLLKGIRPHKYRDNHEAKPDDSETIVVEPPRRRDEDG